MSRSQDGPRVLVVYGTRHGHTWKIAERIGGRLDECGTPADIVQAGKPLSRTLQSYAAVIVASGVWWERHAKSIEKFVFRNVRTLTGMRSAFVSVSGAAASDAGRPMAAACVEKFFACTQWRATETILVGGGEPYSKYGWFTRMIMLRFAKKHGMKRDPRIDYDYTDWRAVDAFARRFSEAVSLARIEAAKTAELATA